MGGGAVLLSTIVLQRAKLSLLLNKATSFNSLSYFLLLGRRVIGFFWLINFSFFLKCFITRQ